MRAIPYSLIVGQAASTLALCWLSAPTFAADMTAVCPASLPSDSFAPAKPPAGWTGFVPAPLHLTGAGMMAGPPEELQYLVPSKEGPALQEYEFQKGDRQRWLWCAYNGGIRISRRLDDRATRCTIMEKRRANKLISAQVKCN